MRLLLPHRPPEAELKGLKNAGIALLDLIVKCRGAWNLAAAWSSRSIREMCPTDDVSRERAHLSPSFPSLSTSQGAIKFQKSLSRDYLKRQYSNFRGMYLFSSLGY
jgi:hypothetical protein